MKAANFQNTVAAAPYGQGLPAVFAESERFFSAAAQLADALGTAFSFRPPQKNQVSPAASGEVSSSPYLKLGTAGLSLCSGGMEIRGDFTKLLPRLRRDRLSQELLVRAARIGHASRPLTAVDATAGLGEDAFLLAAAGFSVRLYEYDPVIAALLADALFRAQEIPELAETASRMELFREDSIPALSNLPFVPDVILLDPMFPERTKSANVKKKFQLLHLLERPCAEEEVLFSAALAAHPHKLVIKRPVKGPCLAGKKPDYSLCGKAVRFDCFVTA